MLSPIRATSHPVTTRRRCLTHHPARTLIDDAPFELVRPITARGAPARVTYMYLSETALYQYLALMSRQRYLVLRHEVQRLESVMPPRSAASGVPRFDRTAAAILDAAAHALSEHGSSTNMADVAAAAGVSRATLYRYYPDREALLDLFGGVLVAALKLTERGQLGLEEASAAAASVFLDGARARLGG